MGWFVVSQILSVLLELIILSGQSEKNKDLEILLLRRQLAMVERKLDTPLRVSRAEKMTCGYEKTYPGSFFGELR